jgi:hypothetical protein
MGAGVAGSGRRGLALLLAALLLAVGVPAAGADPPPPLPPAPTEDPLGLAPPPEVTEPATTPTGGDAAEPFVTDAGTVPLVVEAPGGDPALVAEVVDDAVEVRDLYGSDLVVVEVPAASVPEALADLAVDDGVTFVEYDGLATVALQPNDPGWPRSEQDGFRSARFPQAWDLSTGSSAVVIAILDTGVRPVSELSGRVLPGRNFTASPSTTNTDDNHTQNGFSHGTMAASVAAARGNNGAGIAGACWQCRVLPVKVLDHRGEGLLSSVANGIRWAADEGADVISMSLTSATNSVTVRDAVAYARSKGSVLVAAAGNQGWSLPTYPAAYPQVIGVAGTNPAGTALHPMSNWGTWVAVAGPWENAAQARNGEYYSYQGTSSATPVVAGALALAVGRTRSVGAAELERRVGATSRPLAQIQHGFIDARAIVDGPRLSISTAPGSMFGVERVTVTVTSPSGITGTPTLSVGGRSISLSSSGSGRWVGSWDTRSIAHGSATLAASARNSLGNRTTVSTARRVLNTPPAAGFVDVPRNAFYAVPVDFLKHTGVTTGVGGTNRYEPASIVNRAQMAVFLWRMAGQPRGTGPAFADVSPGSYYAEATRWLRQTGITTGVGGSDRYDPDGVVTRAQMVTFLHRFAGTPRVGRAHSFTDVDRRSFAEQATSWAAFHAVTTGIGGTPRFDPDGWVTRGQMAAFIQRYARTRPAHGSSAIALAV